MTKHTLYVSGKRITFEVHPYPSGETLAVHAPGVLPFDVVSVDQAKDILRSVFHPKASR